MTTMRTVAKGRWAPTLVSLLLLAFLCGLLVYWAMQLLAPQVTIAPSGSLVSAETATDTNNSRALFGTASGKASPVVRKASVNVEVFGVAASEERAAAILSIDGKPASVYGVGQPIDGDEGFTVTSVTASEVVLDHGGEEIRVEVQTSGDLAVLTSGQNTDSSTTAPAANNASARRSRVGQSNRRRGASRPTLQPRRLPPSGAAASAAAARNTTGLPAANTPAANRPGGAGRPRGNRAPIGKTGQSQPNRTRLGTPANSAMQNPQNNVNQATQ